MAKSNVQHGRNRSLETLSEFSRDLGKSVKKDVVEDFAGDFLSQLLGFKVGGSESSKSPDKHLIGDLVTGERNVIFNSKDHKGKGEAPKSNKEKGQKAEKHIEAAIDHGGEYRNLTERVSRAESREIDGRLREIMVELKRLVSTSKVLQMEFANVDVEQAPTQAGEYHINFFDWLLLTIRAARQKVEDSGAWLATAKGKNGKKGGYWGMFKKHGTSFGLSNERGVATQTG